MRHLRLWAQSRATPFGGPGIRPTQIPFDVSVRRPAPSPSSEAPSDGLPAGWMTQNCEMNAQASGGMKAFRPSSPDEVPSSTLDGVCAPSNVHVLTG
jgi:hypothetical protein